MITGYYDELAVGQRTISRARTITETDIVNFAMFTGDWYPLHTDVEYAKKNIFGERIAHGMLVLSVATGLITLLPGPILAFYGMEKVRFTGPTRIGDTIRVESEISEKVEKNPTSGVVSAKVTVLNQRDEAVLVCTMKLLITKKP